MSASAEACSTVICTVAICITVIVIAGIAKAYFSKRRGESENCYNPRYPAVNSSTEGNQTEEKEDPETIHQRKLEEIRMKSELDKQILEKEFQEISALIENAKTLNGEGVDFTLNWKSGANSIEISSKPSATARKGEKSPESAG